MRNERTERSLRDHQSDDQASFNASVNSARNPHQTRPITFSAQKGQIYDTLGEIGRECRSGHFLQKLVKTHIPTHDKIPCLRFALLLFASIFSGCALPKRQEPAGQLYKAVNPVRTASGNEPLSQSLEPTPIARLESNSVAVPGAGSLPQGELTAAAHSDFNRKKVTLLPAKIPDLAEKAAAFRAIETDAPATELGTHSQLIASESSKTVSQYVAMAVAANPKLLALRQRVQALQMRIPQAKALPDPRLQETFWPFQGNALETAGGRAANQIGFSQAMPWPEKRKSLAAIACREVDIARSEVEVAKLEIVEATKLACIEIWLAEEALRVVDEFEDLVKQLNQVSEAQYRSGNKNASQQDVLRAQIESDRLQSRRAQLQHRLRAAQADLSALLHHPETPIGGVVGTYLEADFHEQLNALVAVAVENNPVLRGLAMEIARDREKHHLACLQKYPDFSLAANWLMVSDNNALSPVATGNDNFGFTVGVTLPVWREKIRAGIAEASFQRQSTANILASEKDSLTGKIRRH
ncbi:MAG: TolC family protein, partial [Planctomycetota bacterium]